MTTFNTQSQQTKSNSNNDPVNEEFVQAPGRYTNKPTKEGHHAFSVLYHQADQI